MNWHVALVIGGGWIIIGLLCVAAYAGIIAVINDLVHRRIRSGEWE